MLNQLSSDDFEELIKDKKFGFWMSEKSEFDMGHIKGAELAPSTRFEEGLERAKGKKIEKIALYCLSGNRSDFIGKKLEASGYDKIYNLEMGIVEWLDYGKKLVK